MLLALSLVLAGCAEMMQATPELQSDSSDRKVEVKSRVMAVSTLDYSPDGRQLASGGATPVVRLWDLANAKASSAFSLQAPFGLSDIAYSRDGKLLAASGMVTLLGGTATQIWDVEAGRPFLAAPVPEFGLQLAFSADRRYLFGSVLKLGGLFDQPHLVTKQLDLKNAQIVRQFAHYYPAAVSPEGNHLLLVGSGHEGMMLVDVETGREAWRSDNRKISAAAFLPGGRHLLAAQWDYRGPLVSRPTVAVSLFETATGRQVRELLRYTVDGSFLDVEFNMLVSLAVSPDGSKFIGGNNFGEYRIWDVADGRLIRQLKRPDEKILLDMSPAHAAFSPNGRLVAITSAASVRLYHVDSGEEAVAMIAFDDGEWLVTTPSGYYNASEKGDQYLSVSVAGQPFSISQLRESFYRPDLVRVALAGGTLGEFRRVADIRPPPAVSIVDTPTRTTAQQLPVVLEIADQGGGVGDIRLYRNGSAVMLESARSLAAGRRGTGPQVMRFEVGLEPGQNVIRAIAFNADNSMQSKDATIEVHAEIEARQPALYAVVVGIKDFANPRLALKYSVADAELFAATLESRARGLYSAVRVHRLLKPAETTNEAIVAALKRARHEVGAEDLFVFYVASHGTVDDGQYLLITSNVGSTSSARLKQDALTQEGLKELISNIPASKKLVVLDTCSAGQMGDALQVAMLTRGMSDDTAMKVLSRAVGSTVLSAATSVQEALEGYKNHGLFTYVIAAGLNGAADANHDGFVKTLELADYVDTQVPELAERVFKHKQYPIVSPTGQGFPLVRVR